MQCTSPAVTGITHLQQLMYIFFKFTVNSQSHGHGHMPLRTETTVEYYFDNACLFYCKEHDCFRFSNNHEDSVLLNGVTQKDVNFFIQNYIEYVLEDRDLKEEFQASVKEDNIMKLRENKAEDLTDSEGRPL
jgi:hypothetical protein